MGLKARARAGDRRDPLIAQLTRQAATGNPIDARRDALERLCELGGLPASVLDVAIAAATVDVRPIGFRGSNVVDEDVDQAKRWNLHWAGIATLGNMGAEKPAAARALMSFADPEAFYALSQLGYAGPEVMAHLTEALRPAHTRGPAARALVALGGSPEIAVQAVARELGSADRHDREQAAYDLGSLKSHAACAALKRALSDRIWTVRYAAAKAMQNNACACATIQAALERARTDRAELVRSYAQFALEALFPDAPLPDRTQ